MHAYAPPCSRFRPLRTFREWEGGLCVSASFIRGCDLLAVGGQSGEIRVHETSYGEVVDMQVGSGAGRGGAWLPLRL